MNISVPDVSTILHLLTPIPVDPFFLPPNKHDKNVEETIQVLLHFYCSTFYTFM